MQEVSRLVCKPGKTKAHLDAVSPGQILQKARISKGFTAQEVASSLHLSLNWIEKIEQDQFMCAPALIYIRGYLRAYARLVAVQVSTVLDAFDAMGWEELGPAPAPTPAPSKLQLLRQVIWSKVCGKLSTSVRGYSRKKIASWSAGCGVVVLALLGHHYLQQQRAHKLMPGMLVATGSASAAITPKSTAGAGSTLPQMRVRPRHQLASNN